LLEDHYIHNRGQPFPGRERETRRNPYDNSQVSLDGSTNGERDLLSVLPSQAPDPEAAAEAHEQAIAIEALLARLPEAARQVLRLVDMEGLDYQEAAGVLGLPLGTVKSRLARARLKMRELWSKSDKQLSPFKPTPGMAPRQ
jgi:RNA polymerase sigma-70 factor (ECF subfamily)